VRSTILGTVAGAGGTPTHASSKEHLDLATLTFLVMCAVMMAVIAYTSTHLSSVVSYTRDIWHHLAVYSELIASPLDAMNPHVATDDPSRSYSPWTVFVAILARLGGLDQFGAIAISAMLSSASILLGIFLFARSYYNHAWAPVLLLLAFFGSWGGYINHTGYHAVATFLYSASYPFTIVLGGGFVLWWLTLRALEISQRASTCRSSGGILTPSALFWTQRSMQGTPRGGSWNSRPRIWAQFSSCWGLGSLVSQG